MNKLHYFFGLLCLSVVCIENSIAISCYECNSAEDKRCLGDANNQLSKDLIKTCPEKKGEKPYSLCRKIKQVIDFEVNGLQPDSRIIRSCGYEDSTHKNRCYQRSGFGGRQEVCACEDNDCNGTTSTLLTSAGMSVIAVIGFLAFNYYFYN